MKLILKNIVFFALFFLLSLMVTAQEKNYGILTIKKEDIKRYYDNNVAFFVFKYKKPLFASYKLKGTPFDLNNRPILQSFKPQKTNRHGKQKLGNFYKGILVLYVDSMKAHGIDGTFDIYFYPLNDEKTKEVNYVSYLINNTPDKVTKYTGAEIKLQSHAASGPPDLPPPPFSSFTLNPSPPYKTGGN